MATKYATGGQLADALKGRLTRGTTQKFLGHLLKYDEDVKKLHLTSKPKRRLSYDDQKEAIKIITKKIKKKGGHIKGFGKWGKERGILSAVQKSVKETAQGSSSEASGSSNANEHAALRAKLRQSTGTTIPGAKNSPLMSMQGQGATFSGATLGQKNNAQQNNQAAPEKPVVSASDIGKQDEKVVKKDFTPQPDTAETPEVNLDMPAGFNMKKAA